MAKYSEPDERAALRERLRGLRVARGLSQRELGLLLGVNQKRVARIEAAPELASLGQVRRLLTLLGARMEIVETVPAPEASSVRASLRQGRGRPMGSSAPGVPAARPERSQPAGERIVPEEEARPGTNWSSAWD